jgi:hypothetical protein
MEKNIQLQFENMELRLSEMEDKLDIMSQKQDLLDAKLTQVVDAIVGNPLTKQGGVTNEIALLKAKIEELEKKQLRYESFKNRVSWTVGLVVGAAVILQYIITIYNTVKK